VGYWGQNSYGASHLDRPDLWEKDLSEYCNNDEYDVIPIGFLNVFNAGNGQLPGINFANHCPDEFNPLLKNYMTAKMCPKIGVDIPYCQKKGKTILLSLGGAIAQVGFNNAQEAATFAETVWNVFLGGQHQYRPFGSAVLDGIDLDIEGGSPEFYDVFIAKLREFYAKDNSKKYYIAAAPQCEFPDRSLSKALDNAWFDMVFIQFYNNWCGLQNYDNQWAWNYNVWDNWAKTKSINKNVKLFIGSPAAQTAAGSGYVGVDPLKRILKEVREKYTSFGGLMLWDVSQS
ncbi:glycoside hydrolase family 18 protein, partial [Conidiobolus coronatus NRRL 28638]